jgi:CRP-like cAMP-binding protein
MRSVVQVDATLLCVDAVALQPLFEHSPDLQRVVHRFPEALLGQVIQSSACNALHSVEQRFCRWLLMRSDATASDELP